MSKTVMFARKIVTYAHYEMTKEEFIKDHCSGLSTAIADERWKTLCSLSKEKADEMVWLDEEENEDDDLDYDAVEEFLEEDMWDDEEVYCDKKFSDVTNAEEGKPYADWMFYLTSGGGSVGGYLFNSESKEVVFANKNGFANNWTFKPVKKTLTFHPADEMKGIVARVVLKDIPKRECGSCSEKSHDTHSIITLGLQYPNWCEKCAVEDLDQCSVCGMAKYKADSGKGHTDCAGSKHSPKWRPMTKDGFAEYKTNPKFCF
jgi:hypothetical protein